METRSHWSPPLKVKELLVYGAKNRGSGEDQTNYIAFKWGKGWTGDTGIYMGIVTQ